MNSLLSLKYFTFFDLTLKCSGRRIKPLSLIKKRFILFFYYYFYTKGRFHNPRYSFTQRNKPIVNNIKCLVSTASKSE